jgi:hypothetical protein
MAKLSFSIIETTGGKAEIVASRLTERDAIKQAATLAEMAGGEFRAAATAALKMRDKGAKA